MKCGIFAVPARTGLGSQSIVTLDREGAQIEPTFIYFLNGFCPGDTLVYLSSLGIGTNIYCENHGVYDVAIDQGGSTATAEQYSFSAKICSGGTGYYYPVIELSASPFFGGDIQRYAAVTSTYLGGFDLDFLHNERTGDLLIGFVLGQTAGDLQVKTLDSLTTGATVTVGFAAQGILTMPITDMKGPEDAGVTTGAGGGSGAGYGWATVDGDYGAAHILCQNQGGNARYQRSDCITVGLDATDLSANDGPPIDTWNATEIVVGTGSVPGNQGFAFGGDGVLAAAGSFTVNPADGTQTVDLGLNAKLLMAVSIGSPTSDAVLEDFTAMSVGVTNGADQWCYWTGEITDGNGIPPEGARYLDTSGFVRTATPAGASTTFADILTVTDLGTDGIVTFDVSDASGDEPVVLWFALGEATSPEPPPPASTTYARRWLRRFMLPFNENQRVFLSRIEFLMQTGVGLSTGQGSDPIVMMRLSKDGGFTWGYETQMSMGKIGEYFHRVYANRLGQGRQWVCEISGTDPVPVYLLDCWVDGDAGTN